MIEQSIGIKPWQNEHCHRNSSIFISMYSRHRIFCRGQKQWCSCDMHLGKQGINASTAILTSVFTNLLKSTHIYHICSLLSSITDRNKCPGTREEKQNVPTLPPKTWNLPQKSVICWYANYTRAQMLLGFQTFHHRIDNSELGVRPSFHTDTNECIVFLLKWVWIACLWKPHNLGTF